MAATKIDFKPELRDLCCVAELWVLMLRQHPVAAVHVQAEEVLDPVVGVRAAARRGAHLRTLPLPGGLGGVEGGMIGALIGFGVDGGLAVAAVLSYRVFAYWLPILPGALAYVRLRHTVRIWERGPRAAD